MLTGSANVLLVPKLADSLAGRMRSCGCTRWRSASWPAPPGSWTTCSKAGSRPGAPNVSARQLAERIAAGGYPAALTPGRRRRAAWYRDYLDALVQRDVRDLARISSLDALPRLLALAAGQTARLLNVTDLAGPFQLSRPTIRDYVTLLERYSCWRASALAQQPPEPARQDAETAPRRYRLACALLGLDAAALADDRVPRSTTRNVRLPGTAAAGELA